MPPSKSTPDPEETHFFPLFDGSLWVIDIQVILLYRESRSCYLKLCVASAVERSSYRQAPAYIAFMNQLFTCQQKFFIILSICLFVYADYFRTYMRGRRGEQIS